LKRSYFLLNRANDICKESKRQTINAEDVLKALDEIEFPEFIEPLGSALEGL
jgi:DNA polymerase epsilon subunit 3